LAVNILCMKWGSFYGSEYANRLYAGVLRHMSRPFRFVCFTDDDRGLDAGIEALPLPEVPVPGSDDLRWRKVGVFRADLFGLSGSALFLDLDVVVVDDLAPIFDLPGGFHVCHERTLFPHRLRAARRFLFKRRRYRWANREGNTSVFRFEIASHSAIFDRYRSDAARIVRKFRREQEFVTLEARRMGILNYLPPEMVVSFRDGCVRWGIPSYLTDPEVPEGARVVVFTSGLTMEDALTWQGSRWYRRVPPVDWLQEAWSDAPVPS
jgi:hypothetical protein